ncbi:MAG: hypothetical protein QUT30_06135, partial [Acidobacteriota bacterium]|nr:hypothetical protein [Acidobacteriota bacterium]
LGCEIVDAFDFDFALARRVLDGRRQSIRGGADGNFADDERALGLGLGRNSMINRKQVDRPLPFYAKV